MAWCILCSQSFGSHDALNQHAWDSPAHAPSYDCDPCNQSFSSQDALDQHAHNSPAHALSYDCNLCNQSFSSQDALNQHARNSPAHVPSYDCDLCDQSFSSQDSLNQHIQHSSTHFQPHTTPLNRFFQSFSGFTFDPNLPPAESYALLQKFYGWRKGDPDSDQAWNEYQEALVDEFNLWFGSENDLGAWHSLCCAVKIEPIPKTCLDCEKVL